jgi:DNA-binding transcriptional LysR family regulator
MVEHARAINARLNAAREDVGAVASAGAGTIRIGTFQSVSQTLLPQVVHELTTSKPRLAASLREDPSVDHLATMLESGELDVAFVLLPVAGEELETVEVLRDPWLLAVRTDHPLVWQQRSVTAGDLSNLPLIAFEQVPTQKIVEGSLRAAGASLRVVTRLADYASVLSMVSAGLGCGLVPRLAVEAEAGLSFLGLGIEQPTASWGNLLSQAPEYYLTQPWLMVWPGLSILLATLAFNLLGDGLRDAFDPRAKI